MVQLDNFETYLESISKENWNKLFELIPKIEAADTYGIIEQESPLFLKVKHCAIVDNVMSQLQSMDLFPLFEWILWKNGQKIINDYSFDLTLLSLKELCMLLTIIYRLDEFNEGFLVSKFEDGMMLNILKTIQIKNEKN